MAASSLRVGCRAYSQLAGDQLLGDRAQRAERSALAGDQPGRAEDHRAAVVHGVVEHRPGADQAVQQGDGDADVLARRRPAGTGWPTSRAGRACRRCGRSRWQHDGRAVDDHAQVAHQPGVEHRIELSAIGSAAFA